VPDLPEVPVTVVTVEPGDVLCLYSDGVTEAQNGAGELFDVERMCAVIEQAMADGKVLDEVTRAVFDEVERFSGRHDDDWTMLLAKRG
jgi:sigma-B regulation protein RsbU (phosphoserine phosphatase)